MNEFKIFKSISIGGVNKEVLIQKLVDHGVQFNVYAHTLFAHPAFAVPEKPEAVDLVKISMSDLGFSEPHMFGDITKKANELGLKLCPLYLGAFLRLEYLEQPESPYLTIASAKPENDDEHPNGFYVRHLDGVLWLRGYRASDDYEWPLDSEFVFVKP